MGTSLRGLSIYKLPAYQHQHYPLRAVIGMPCSSEDSSIFVLLCARVLTRVWVEHCFRHRDQSVSLHVGQSLSATNEALAERIRQSGNASTSYNKEPRAAYVHLPFCKRKCFYCDFPVVATGSRHSSPEVQDSMQASHWSTSAK